MYRIQSHTKAEQEGEDHAVSNGPSRLSLAEAINVPIDIGHGRSPPPLIFQTATAIFPPQHITDGNKEHTWQIPNGTLLCSLQALHEELYCRRESVDVTKALPFGDDLDLMALLCHAERKIRGGPCLTAVGPRLSLEPCRIVTSPPLTGLVISIGVYGEHRL